jgi:crotonobetainyl-CoA:carnitine CoA-transferase CaiB-like acyl-CoA transferase
MSTKHEPFGSAIFSYNRSMNSANPLAGVHVVSMGLNVPAPLAVARLAGRGATVVKIEPPSGDPLEEICPAWYADLHRHVTVERVNLKSADGRSRLWALLEPCDLFVSSQRPSALARLGLDSRSLAKVRWLNIVGECSQPEIPGHDLTYQARAGLLRGGMPVSLLADIMGSERAFGEMLLLLRQAPGAHAVVGLFDSLAPLVATSKYGVTSPGGILGGGLPAYRVYAAREGQVAVAALEPHFRERLYSELALPPGSDLTAAMRTRSADEWEQWAAERDLPIAAVRT